MDEASGRPAAPYLLTPLFPQDTLHISRTTTYDQYCDAFI